MNRLYVHLSCPHCQGQLNIPVEYCGSIGTCRLCGTSFTVPPMPDSQPYPSGAGISTGINLTPQVAADTAPRRGVWKIVISLLVALVVLCSAVGVFAWVNWEREPQVYLSSKDHYYYYYLCLRARSLGLGEDSPTYTESSVLAKGYEPVPAHLRDSNALQERTEQASAQRAAAMQREHAESGRTSIDSDVERVRQLIRDTIIAVRNRADLPTRNNVFSEWTTTQTGSSTYRFDVLLDAFGDGASVEWWYAELRRSDYGGWDVVAVDTNAPEQINIQSLQRVTGDLVLKEMDEPSNYRLENFRYRDGALSNTYVVQWSVKPLSHWERDMVYQLEVTDRGRTWQLDHIEEVPKKRIWR